MIWFLLANPGLRKKRGRAFAVTGGVLALVAGLLFFVPVPHATIAEGVVWVPGEQIIHSEADGVVVEVAARPDQHVAPGVPLARLEDPLIAARARMLSGYIEELDRRLAATSFADRSAARVLQEERTAASADLEVTRQRLDALSITSGATGQLVLAAPEDLVGRFVRKGDVIGYVTNYMDPLIRVIVPEARSDLVRSETVGLQVRFASDPDRVEQAWIEREIPALTADLPSLALAAEGGGRVALDPNANGRRVALSKLLHLDVRIGSDTRFQHLGERVFVRFDHGSEALANQVYRAARQIFLRTFRV